VNPTRRTSDAALNIQSKRKWRPCVYYKKAEEVYRQSIDAFVSNAVAREESRLVAAI
jgi:hypothetical protein